MEIFINIAGTELNSKRAAKQLHQIADMVKAGVTELDGFSVEYGGAFGMNVDFESDGTHNHTDYWDGEHNHLHVDEEGIVISRRGPDKADGTGDLEQVHEKGIKITDWAKDHGGITPFDTPEAHGHEH
jgi:hypothetical protein